MILVVNADTGIINSFTDGEFNNFLANDMIYIPLYKYYVDESIKSMKSKRFIFYINTKTKRMIPRALIKQDFNDYIQGKLTNEQLRNKYKKRLISKDDLDIEKPIVDERKFIRREIDNPKLIVDNEELKKNRLLGEGGYGVVSYDHDTKTIIKTSKNFETTLHEFLAIKENPILKNYNYKFDFNNDNDDPMYYITSKISGERTLNEITVPKNINSRKIARLILDMLLQLKYLHSVLNIYHRDIKEYNILVSKQDGNYISHFIDYGLSYIDVRQDDKNTHALSYYCSEYYNGNLSKLNSYDSQDIEKSDVCGLGSAILRWLVQDPNYIFLVQTNFEANQLKSEYIRNYKNRSDEENQQIFDRVHVEEIKGTRRYTKDDATKQNFENELLYKIGYIQPDDRSSVPSEELLDFLWNMINPKINYRYTVDHLLEHPYLSSYAYKPYVDQYPFIPYLNKDVVNDINGLDDSYKRILNNLPTNLKKYKILNYLSKYIINHSINLFSRCLNEHEWKETPPLYIEIACVMISTSRLSEITKTHSLVDKLGIDKLQQKKSLNVLIFILNNIDCRCGIHESEIYNIV